MKIEDITIEVASEKHLGYVERILTSIEEAAQVRGTGIARRKPEYIARKIEEAKAVIALHGDDFAGFSYIETWEHKRYVTTSGLIVRPEYRGLGIAKKIKDLTFSLARTRWPNAKIFSLTSGAAVMAMNTKLGYKPVTFAELTNDEAASMWTSSRGRTGGTASAPGCCSTPRSTFPRRSPRMSLTGSLNLIRKIIQTKKRYE